MTKEQIQAVKCAYADLTGAYQSCIEQSDIYAHDWDAHLETINDLLDAFDFLQDDPV